MNGTGSSRPVRYTLEKNERLHGKARFDFLFAHISYINAPEFRLGYCSHFPDALTSAPVMFAVVAPKRIFKRANRRNLIKRRVREAWRIIRPEMEPRLLHLCPLALVLIWRKPEPLAVRNIQDQLRASLVRLSGTGHELSVSTAE